MGMTAYVIGNITLLTTKVDQKILNFRAKVSEVNSYLLYKVRLFAAFGTHVCL
jgi:hypothetical protein